MEDFTFKENGKENENDDFRVYAEIDRRTVVIWERE